MIERSPGRSSPRPSRIRTNGWVVQIRRQPLWRRMRSSSEAVICSLSGSAIAPARTIASSASTHSGWLGASSPTISPSREAALAEAGGQRARRGRASVARGPGLGAAGAMGDHRRRRRLALQPVDQVAQGGQRHRQSSFGERAARRRPPRVGAGSQPRNPCAPCPRDVGPEAGLPPGDFRCPPRPTPHRPDLPGRSAEAGTDPPPAGAPVRRVAGKTTTLVPELRAAGTVPSASCSTSWSWVTITVALLRPAGRRRAGRDRGFRPVEQQEQFSAARQDLAHPRPTRQIPRGEGGEAGVAG